MKKHKTVKETKTEALIKNNTIKTMTEYSKTTFPAISDKSVAKAKNTKKLKIIPIIIEIKQITTDSLKTKAKMTLSE